MNAVRRRRVWVFVAVVLVGLGALAGAAFLPWSANHFGYALPGDQGLPYRVEYGDRDYRSHVTCAGADWCEPGTRRADVGTPYCTPRAELELGRLHRVGEVPTLWGSPHAMFLTMEPQPGTTPIAVLVEATDGCYVSFILMGGP
ncbi:hypothetical protein [Actinophytocola xanthii]|uniref:Uncharacterized protein n=1 Tax=Actinophytocola xanthii TaxID=1912961 RepID=A0A1Q8CXQ1_9PSEU|nr:hypothetical protein [Actinophytocola xanthii]OLF19130.1 hypothetical protein BU204_01795 [Actinophytocola xanthii]